MTPLAEKAGADDGAPWVETARLVLRARTPRDFDAYAAMWADPVVTRHFPGGLLSREAAFVKFLRMAGHWRLYGFGFWLIEEKASGAMIGEAGIATFERDVFPPLEGAAEAGWVMASAAHGKGYAREAVAAALCWADARTPGLAISCLIDPDNAPSFKVAAAMGFVQTRIVDFHGKDVVALLRAPV